MVLTLLWTTLISLQLVISLIVMLPLNHKEKIYIYIYLKRMLSSKSIYPKNRLHQKLVLQQLHQYGINLFRAKTTCNKIYQSDFINFFNKVFLVFSWILIICFGDIFTIFIDMYCINMYSLAWSNEVEDHHKNGIRLANKSQEIGICKGMQSFGNGNWNKWKIKGTTNRYIIQFYSKRNWHHFMQLA